MKAAVVEKQGTLVVQEVPDPEVGEYDALCEILYGATCSATDHHIIANHMPFPVSYPTMLGHESIGRVVAMGKRVRNFKAGDIVTRVGASACPKAGLFSHWGGFAEKGIARDYRVMRQEGRPQEEWDHARRNQVLPADFDPASATMIITWRETLSYLTRMGVGPGAAVLVIGSGGNGLAFVTHARNLGAAQMVIVGNAARESHARLAGATAFFDYQGRNLGSLIGNACGKEFNFIIDSVGKKDSLNRMLPLLCPNGTVGIYGIEDYGQCNINPNLARGTFVCYQGYLDEEEAHEQVIAFIRQGRLDASLWLDRKHAFSLSDINTALEAVQRRELIKALIRIKA